MSCRGGVTDQGVFEGADTSDGEEDDDETSTARLLRNVEVEDGGKFGLRGRAGGYG